MSAGHYVIWYAILDWFRRRRAKKGTYIVQGYVHNKPDPSKYFVTYNERSFYAMLERMMNDDLVTYIQVWVVR